jgi:hypothetical protein
LNNEAKMRNYDSSVFSRAKSTLGSREGGMRGAQKRKSPFNEISKSEKDGIKSSQYRSELSKSPIGNLTDRQ